MSDSTPEFTSSDYMGKFPIEQEITILPADNPKSLKLGWVIYEEMATTNNTFDYTGRAFDTDEADKYLHSQGVAPPKDGRWVYCGVYMLQNLYGKPWNNLALNMVMALNPTKIRVAKDSVTCDAMDGRVTVWLEQDGRSIRSIRQELKVGGIGVKSGEDLSHKLHGLTLPEQSDEPYVHVNEAAVGRIRL